jgi:hypothetical protein
MFAPHRTATGLTLALLALPATATAQSTDSSGGGGGGAPAITAPLPYGAAGLVQPIPDERAITPPPQSLVSPDAADAARAGDIAKAMEHYRRSQPVPAAARPASPPAGGYQVASHDDNTPAWPEFAFAGVVLLGTAGGVVTVRMRRRRSARVAA